MNVVIAIIIVGALVLALSSFEGWIFMLLVNWVLRLFEITFALTFLQAWGIMILLNFINFIFKSNNNRK